MIEKVQNKNIEDLHSSSDYLSWERNICVNDKLVN